MCITQWHRLQTMVAQEFARKRQIWHPLHWVPRDGNPAVPSIISKYLLLIRSARWQHKLAPALAETLHHAKCQLEKEHSQESLIVLINLSQQPVPTSRARAAFDWSVVENSTSAVLYTFVLYCTWFCYIQYKEVQCLWFANHPSHEKVSWA